MEKPTNYGNYRKSLIRQMWKYRKERFAGREGLFDRRLESDSRPPVFASEAADHNVIVNPDGRPDDVEAVRSEIGRGQRHRWYGSMMSSQALAQSIFGNLKVYGKLGVLSALTGENGMPLFFPGTTAGYSLILEHETKSLCEPRPTSIDVFLDGPHTVAVECKLGEAEVGPCSQFPANCDGKYKHQKKRKHRCYLTERGMVYWKLIPELFKWSSELDHDPCPLWKTYQLVRNVLVACTGPDCRIDPGRGHAVLIHDNRNPAFQPLGEGWKAFALAKGALKAPQLLQSCTWQQVAAAIRDDRELAWLSEELEMKYGL